MFSDAAAISDAKPISDAKVISNAKGLSKVKALSISLYIFIIWSIVQTQSYAKKPLLSLISFSFRTKIEGLFKCSWRIKDARYDKLIAILCPGSASAAIGQDFRRIKWFLSSAERPFFGSNTNSWKLNQRVIPYHLRARTASFVAWPVWLWSSMAQSNQARKSCCLAQALRIPCINLSPPSAIK